jgi:hypothetical protein
VRSSPSLLIHYANYLPSNLAYIAYVDKGYQSDLLYSGDQWAPTLNYTDPFFGSVRNFDRVYVSWLRSKGFTYNTSYNDVASAMAGFVMQKALETTRSFSQTDIIAALKAVSSPQDTGCMLRTHLSGRSISLRASTVQSFSAPTESRNQPAYVVRFCL